MKIKPKSMLINMRVISAAIVFTALGALTSRAAVTAYNDQTLWENDLIALGFAPFTETFDGIAIPNMQPSGSPYVVNSDFSITVEGNTGNADEVSIDGGEFRGRIFTATEHSAYRHDFNQPLIAFGQSFVGAASGLGLRLESAAGAVDIFDDGGYSGFEDGFFGFIADTPINSVSVVGSDANGGTPVGEIYQALDVSYALKRQITWSAPVTITDETDISTLGTLVHAGSWGSTGVVNVDVGTETIPFADMAASGDNGGTIRLTGFGAEVGNATFFDATGTNVGPEFETVLDGFGFQPGAATGEKKVTLLDLTVGSRYQLQVFISDDRASTQTIQLGDTSNISQTNPTLGSLSAEVKLTDSPMFTGTFVAENTSQDFFLFGPSTNLRSISAYQLRDITGVLPGDFDVDGDVDGRDFLQWQRSGSPNPLSSTDLTLWQTQYGLTVPPGSATQLIPEPRSLIQGLMILIGGLNHLCRRK